MAVAKTESWLERFKGQWDANQAEANSNSLADSNWSCRTADRCDSRSDLLLREIIIRLSMEPVLPSDFFDRPFLVELIEAAKHATKRTAP